MEEKAFSCGTPIITEGDEGTTFYIIIEGTVRVTQWQTRNGRAEQTVLVEQCSRGDSFGEVALIKTYDSATDGRTRFTIHTAFSDPLSPEGAMPRQSIETRCFAFF